MWFERIQSRPLQWCTQQHGDCMQGAFDGVVHICKCPTYRHCAHYMSGSWVFLNARNQCDKAPGLRGGG